jgi:hypothetical protein
MKKYLILTFAFWTVYITLNAIMDSIVYHVNSGWYWNMTAWHIIKPFAILALFMTGWYAGELWFQVDYPKTLHINPSKKAIRKRRIRKGLTIAFFVFYGMLWRWVLFEHLIDTFAVRR